MNISFYLIPKSEVTYLMAEESIEEALHIMYNKRYQAVPIINKEGKYVGTVTEGDFLWTLKDEYDTDLEDMKKEKVGAISKNWDYRPVSIDANIKKLDQYIVNQNFVPVVDSRGIFIGIVTRKKIIEELLRQQEKRNAGYN